MRSESEQLSTNGVSEPSINCQILQISASVALPCVSPIASPPCIGALHRSIELLHIAALHRSIELLHIADLNLNYCDSISPLCETNTSHL